MKIKNLILPYLVILTAFLVFSCSGKEDDTQSRVISLKTDITAILADGVESVQFNVTLDGIDVSDRSEIYEVKSSEKINGTKFTTTQAGSYIFYAIYDGMRSENITITAQSIADIHTYKRHVAVFKLTGTWCSWCPDGGRRLDYILNNETYKNAHILSFHGGDSAEPMLIPETQLLYDKFSVSAYPTVIVDMREEVAEINLEKTREALKRSLNDYPAYYGVEIESDLNSNNKSADIKVTITNSVEDKYRIILYVVENNIVYPQKDGGVTHETFVHDHVVRKLISQSYLGDRTESLIPGNSLTQQYNVDLDIAWNIENLKVYALVVSEKTGFIHNMAFCNLNEGKMNSKD